MAKLHWIISLFLLCSCAFANEISIPGWGLFDIQNHQNISFVVLGVNYQPASNATFSMSNGSEIQMEVATAGIPVHWQINISVIGMGTCNYSITKLAVQNNTTISGNATNNGNQTDISFACNQLNSPYSIDFYTEAIGQADNGQVIYGGIAQSSQRKITISMSKNQSIAYLMQYSISTPNPYLYQCAYQSSSLCVNGAPWTATTFAFDGNTVQKTLTLTSNETTFIIAWGGTSSGGGAISIPQNITPQNATQNATKTQEPLIPEKIGLWESFKEWVKGSSFGLGNYVVASFLLIILIALIINAYYSQNKPLYLPFAGLAMILLLMVNLSLLTPGIKNSEAKPFTWESFESWAVSSSVLFGISILNVWVISICLLLLISICMSYFYYKKLMRYALMAFLVLLLLIYVVWKYGGLFT